MWKFGRAVHKYPKTLPHLPDCCGAQHTLVTTKTSKDFALGPARVCIRKTMWPRQMGARQTGHAYDSETSDKWPKFPLSLGQNGRNSSANKNHIKSQAWDSQKERKPFQLWSLYRVSYEREMWMGTWNVNGKSSFASKAPFPSSHLSLNVFLLLLVALKALTSAHSYFRDGLFLSQCVWYL